MWVADAARLPFYLTEANSYYFGGRDGVSNVLAAALWGADFMLALAQRGVTGIQFHGGGLLSVEASLGRDANTGATSTDPSAHRDAIASRYSAMAGDVALGFQPRPLYHGMLLAQQFAGARMVPGQFEAAGVNLTSYTALRDDAMQIALINKDAAHDATIAVSGLQGLQQRVAHAVSHCRWTAVAASSSKAPKVLLATQSASMRTVFAASPCHLEVPHGFD